MMRTPSMVPRCVNRRPTPENRRALADRLGRDAEMQGDGDGGECVADVVVARDGQAAVGDRRAIVAEDVEAHPAAFGAQIHRAEVGAFGEAVGHDAPVAHLGGQIPQFGMIGAEDGEAVEGDLLHEAEKARAQGVEVAPVVEVFGVDVGDDGDGRRQAVERAVRFVGLDHCPVALAQPRVRAVGVDDAAVDHRRIEPARVQQRRHQRRRRGLAVGAGDRDGALQAHDLGQHLRAVDHRQAAAAGLDQFGVVLLDRGRDDDDAGGAQVLGAVALVDGDAQPFQPLGDLRAAGIRALDGMTEAGEDLGDARHADAADADEMDRARVRGQQRAGDHACACMG
jgi:hypothetical protein